MRPAPTLVVLAAPRRRFHERCLSKLTRTILEERMRFLTSAAVAALLLCPLAAQAQISDGTVKIGILNDQSGVYADFGGKWSYRGRQDGGRGFRRQGAERADRGRHRRPPEQARRRLEPRPPVVRHRQGRRHHGADDLLGGARRAAALQGEEEDQHRDRRGDDRPHRQGLHAVRLPLGLRHPGARGRHRRRARREGRRHLVLPHRGLRLRPFARGARPGATSSRRAARSSAPCATP